MTSESGEYSIRFVSFPQTIRGATVLDESGFSNIYINSRLSCYERERAIRHELRHVRNDDAYQQTDIEIVEDEAEHADVWREPAERPQGDQGLAWEGST